MSLNVKYIDAPVGAQDEARATATASQPFSSAEQIVSGATDMPYATLEPSSWSLDGSRALFGNSPENIGWWSKERTGDDGRFAEPPVINISFPQPYTATGFTFVFWPSMNQWCSEINVTWYNGDNVLANVAANPDGPSWILANAVEAFDRIEVKLLETNMPSQFAKIQQIQIGQVVVFLQDELTRVSLLNEIDPSLCELSTDTLTIEILEKKDRALIPQKNQEMCLIRDGVQIALQYITDSSRENQRFYTFRCQSAIGRLEDEFLGGIYNGYPIDTLLSAVLEGFAADWEPFSGQKVTGYLPVCTKREALQQIAFAIGAVVTTQGNGAIRLVPLSENVEAEFTGDNIFSGAKVSREAQTATVQVFSHRFAASSETENLLENEEINGSNVLYVFADPHYEYSISGGSIVSSGENWVRISASGAVTLTGKKYLHSTSVRKIENQYATAAEKGNVVSVEDATLVHSGNVEAVLTRLYNYNTLKNVLTQEVVVEGQRSGQKAKSINPWGNFTVGYITSMESEFTNTGHTANITIRGKEEKV
ncbi:MAG: hypothetical protein IKT52_08535 [Oscillospiraceae bacterium]|nr:hypothetical protein [Oscillospiraceae bacterium]